MSTIKVNKIENTDTTNGGVQIDVDGHVTIDGQQLPTAGPLSNRNLVYNGAMQVAQRGTTGISQVGNNNYVVDGFIVNIDGQATVTHSQESTGAPEGFRNWLKLSPSVVDSSLASLDYGTVASYIEGLDFAHVGYGTANAQTLTVSFKFKTNKAGTYCMIHRNGLADRNYLHEFTPVADGSWQTITYTVPGDTTGTWQTDNQKGWRFELCIGNGTGYQSSTTGSWFSGTYYHSTPNQVNFLDSTSNELGITGVQVELGTKSTPFEHRSYSDELQRCQRYYYKHPQAKYRPSIIDGNGGYACVIAHHPVTMRATPTAGLITHSTFYFNPSGNGNSSMTPNGTGSISYSGDSVTGFACLTGNTNLGGAAVDQCVGQWWAQVEFIAEL